MTTFPEFFHERMAKGGFTTEDALASFVPLVRQVVGAHRAGLVAPLQGLEDLRVDGGHIGFDDSRCVQPRTQLARLHALEKSPSRAVDVVGEMRVTFDVTEGAEKVLSLQIGSRGQEITRPVYLAGYICWEHEIGHHDPLTDTFSLGLILASLACGLDLNDPAELARFVNCRRNLFELNQQLHPVLAKAVARMTDLDRHRRPQDLASLLHTLENYRDQDIDFELELARNVGFREQDPGSRRRLVLHALQQRLFEISRRNRLLHFRQTMQTVNLTVASVPLSFDVANIRPEQILTWNTELQDQIVAGKVLSLNKYLRFEEALYLPSLLDRIRSEAQRDQVEFGFGQLRLVLCFLRWSNLKEKPPERFDSPLILLPVRLIKKKGVRDTYALEPLGSEAEVNPVLRYYFKQLYDVALPETLDLTATSLEAFHQELAAKIQVSEPAVTVERIDRPRIQLIQAKAQRRLDQYVRRTHLAGRGIRTLGDLDYSYDPANFHPLGLRLFQSRIRAPQTNLQVMMQQMPRPRIFMAPEAEAAPPVAEQERQLYSLNESEASNPFLWEYDLCSVTLGNFRYRKMSLVRDYAALVDNGAGNVPFDAIFSLEPRTVRSTPITPPPLEDRYPVLTCDPTQTSALAWAWTGQSYIIQGPPGTGKSQTIANLIADYISRGQRVLFVCEKRAAIDVVYHRLKQNGLDRLCSLIHDSQEDKKEFIMDLKQTYESFLESAGSTGAPAEPHRQELLRAVQRELHPLQHFHEFMCSPRPEAQLPPRRLLHRLVELHECVPQLSPREKERLPPYAQWQEHQEIVERLTTGLKEIQSEGMLARHPLRHLTVKLAGEERPLEKVLAHLQKVMPGVDEVDKTLGTAGLEAGECATLEQGLQLVRHAEQARFLAEKKLTALLRPKSELSKSFASYEKEYRKRARQHDDARSANKRWQHKLPAPKAAAALEQARTFERSFFSFLKPGWWRLGRTLRRCYDFRAHQVKPTWTQILEGLVREYQAQASLAKFQTKARQTFPFAGSFQEFSQKVRALRQQSAELPAELQNITRRLLGTGTADAMLLQLADLRPQVEQLTGELSAFLDGGSSRSLAQLRDELAQIEQSLDDLPDFLVCLAEAARLPAELFETMREVPLPADALEAALARQTLEELWRTDRAASRFTGQVRAGHVRQLEKVHEQLYAANAAVVRERVRQRFLEHVRVASVPHAQLNADQKEFKTIYNRGRRDLEHEFGKTMRYRSIRDLVTGDSGLVIRDLKPVWLMSPLSVSDTLPLETAHFDVVIFDEASQVTLEEAVPSLFRAGQVIVVGDQMQLPPTNFFSAKHNDQESLLLEDETGGQVLEYDLDGNSFLSQAARVLPSTMLGWHYRSRSEALISFSNAAFYQGQLLTVPERGLPSSGWSALRVSGGEEVTALVDELLGRALSFHFVANGIYEDRCNRAEADYIARVVRELLARATGLSIGIIAFSEAQQGEIQDALARLAEQDPEFRERLESEYEREEQGQFAGLLVKNLENIQGDERDLVILSVCYGPGANGKMLMNFGPINQSGGEKRLNVAFSRAKRHMALISSIHHHAITNDYNDGARCLKNYLRYAEAVSLGDLGTAGRVLRELSLGTEEASRAGGPQRDAVVEQLTAALAGLGYQVDRDVGQSSFRCDLAVRRAGDTAYRAGILVDTDAYYRQADILERDVMRPRLLQSFGWTVAHVLTQDWWQNRAGVLESLARLLQAGSPPDPKGRENGAAQQANRNALS
jgi:hypothetical protein